MPQWFKTEAKVQPTEAANAGIRTNLYLSMALVGFTGVTGPILSASFPPAVSGNY